MVQDTPWSDKDFFCVLTECFRLFSLASQKLILSVYALLGKPNTGTSAVGIKQICGEMQLIPGTHAAQQWDPKCPSALGSADVGLGQDGLGMHSLSLLWSDKPRLVREPLNCVLRRESSGMLSFLKKMRMEQHSVFWIPLGRLVMCLCLFFVCLFVFCFLANNIPWWQSQLRKHMMHTWSRIRAELTYLFKDWTWYLYLTNHGILTSWVNQQQL